LPKDRPARTVVALATSPLQEKAAAAIFSAPTNVNVPVKASPHDKAVTVDQPVAAAVPKANDKAPSHPGAEPIVRVAMVQDATPARPAPAPGIITGPITNTASKPVQPVVRHVMAPQDVDLIVTRFNDAVRAGEFDSAKTLLGKVTDGLGDDSLVVLRMHGFLALKMGDLRQAREDYQRVAASLQNDYEANRNLAVIELREGNPDLSKKRSKHMLEIYPDDPVFKVLAN
jgi:tetratricopeptide (TPR) repeat protein